MRIFNDFWKWLTGFFKTEPKEGSKPTRVKQKRRKYVQRKKNISSLLGNLNHEFKELNASHAVFKSCRMDFPSHLMKMGPTVCDSLSSEKVGDRVLTDKRPTWIFFALSGDNGTDSIPIKYIGLEKISKPSPYVEPTKNTVYRAYFCWKADGKHMWVSCYASISDSGEIRVLREMLSEQVRLPNGRGYSKRYWSTPRFFDDHNMIKECISSAFAFCARKERYWVISVKKQGKRMNFAIPREDTKHYFSDRDTVVMSGKKRTKILHYVEGHERNTKNGTVWVRPHIRGERSFSWNDYECNIKAPDFGGFEVGSFDVGGSQEEDATIEAWDVAKVMLKGQDEVQDNAFSRYRA